MRASPPWLVSHCGSACTRYTVSVALAARRVLRALIFPAGKIKIAASLFARARARYEARTAALQWHAGPLATAEKKRKKKKCFKISSELSGRHSGTAVQVRTLPAMSSEQV